MRRRYHIFRRLPLLIEALAALMLASLLIAVFSFRRVAGVAGRDAAVHQPVSPPVAQAIDVAIGVWARRVPWRALCFQRGLAAQLMLRRRKLAATLFYGARRDEAGTLVAHVWVRSGDVDVTGCEDIANYGLLAAFPSRA